jgi:hypothetical protein
MPARPAQQVRKVCVQHATCMHLDTYQLLLCLGAALQQVPRVCTQGMHGLCVACIMHAHGPKSTAVASDRCLRAAFYQTAVVQGCCLVYRESSSSQCIHHPKSLLCECSASGRLSIQCGNNPRELYTAAKLCVLAALRHCWGSHPAPCSPLGLLFSVKLFLPASAACRGAADIGLLAPGPRAPAAAVGSRPKYSCRLYAASAAREVKLGAALQENSTKETTPTMTVPPVMLGQQPAACLSGKLCTWSNHYVENLMARFAGFCLPGDAATFGLSSRCTTGCRCAGRLEHSS